MGLIAIVLELALGVTAGFDLVVVGLALLVGGTVGLVFGNWQIGLIVSIVLAVFYVILGRKMLRSSIAISTQTTNVDRLIGKQVHVVKAITSRKAGQVEVEGELWRAQADKKIPVGAEVTISSVEGVTLKVVESDN